MQRIRSIPGRIFELDNLVLLAIGILIGLALTFGLPEFLPQVRSGVACTSLSPPDFETDNRSLLAISGEDVQELALEVIIPESIQAGSAIELEVVFINDDIGPITLYLPDREPYYGPSANSLALSLQVTDANTGNVVLTLNNPIPGVTGAFNELDLHLLQAQSSCREVYPLDEAETLLLTPGNYRITATYRNSNPGALTVPSAIWTNQNVWAGGEITSDTVEFTITAATQ